MQNIFHAMDEPQRTSPGPWPGADRENDDEYPNSEIRFGGRRDPDRAGRLEFWPSGGGKDQWWLAPPAAWGREITASLKSINALTYREGYVFVGDYGSTHISGSWTRYYKATDRERYDHYYKDTLVDTYMGSPG